jgi:hypothetical protein
MSMAPKPEAIMILTNREVAMYISESPLYQNLMALVDISANKQFVMKRHETPLRNNCDVNTCPSITSFELHALSERLQRAKKIIQPGSNL